jgi:hypothetical protein
MDTRTSPTSITPTRRPGVSGLAGRRWRNRAGVGLLTALTAASYAVFALTRQYTVHTTSYDLVIFDQAVRSYAHFQPGTSIIKGVHNGFGPGFSVLGDHWSPAIAVLAPAYWIHNGPTNLLVAPGVRRRWPGGRGCLPRLGGVCAELANRTGAERRLP